MLSVGTLNTDKLSSMEALSTRASLRIGLRHVISIGLRKLDTPEVGLTPENKLNFKLHLGNPQN